MAVIEPGLGRASAARQSFLCNCCGRFPEHARTASHARSAAPAQHSTPGSTCPPIPPLGPLPRSPHTELAAYTTEHPVYRHINMRMQVGSGQARRAANSWL